MKSKNIVIREPKTEQDFELYYDLRWRILRKPWNQLKGSELDETDKDSIHIIAIKGDKVIGCGRGNLNTKEQAQIRYMAVDESFRRQGFGIGILKALEENLTENGAEEIILKAREEAIAFYEKHGYKIYEEGEILFGEIKHYWMRKK